MHPTVDSEEETLDDRVERSVLLKRSHQQRSYNSNRDLSDTRKKSYQQQQINPLPPFDTVGESHSPAEGQSLQYSGGEGNIANLEYDPDMLDRILAAEDEYLQQDEMVVLARQVPPVGRQIMTFEALDALDVTEDMDELLQEGLELFHRYVLLLLITT